MVIETQFDLSEALTAIRAVRSVCDLPIICSFSYDRGSRTMMGLKPQQVAEALNQNDDVFAIGVNCGKSLEDNVQVLQVLREKSEKPLWFKPNAGAPQTDGEGSLYYPTTPQQVGDAAQTWIENGAAFVGGCCGTSPEHLAAIATTAHSNKKD